MGSKVGKVERFGSYTAGMMLRMLFFTVHDCYICVPLCFSHFQLIFHLIYNIYIWVFLQEIKFVVNIHINFTSI